MNHLIRLAGGALLALAATGAAAQTPANADRKVYCWDEGSRRVCGDALPASAVDAARTEISARSGMRMAEVEARYGAPAERLDPRGGQKRDWPTINRWVYPGFTVYFERDRVVNAVLNKAASNEIGPKPAIR